MSGSFSPRYQVGQFYDPSMRAGTYGRMPNVGRAPSGGVSPDLGVTPVATIDANGIAVRPGAGVVTAAGGDGGGGGMEMMLASALGLLPYVPDAVDLVGRLTGVGGEEALPLPPEFLTEEQAAALNGGPQQAAGMSAAYGVPVVPFGGAQFGYVPAGSSPWSPAGGEGIFWDPTGAASNLGGVTPSVGGEAAAGLGAAPAADASAGFAAAPVDAAAAGVGSGAIGAGMTDLLADIGVTGSLGSIGGFDIGGGLLDAGAGYLGSLMSRDAALSLGGGTENAGYGQAIGSTIGGIAGSVIPVIGTLVGSALGGLIGGGVGGQIGPPPTVGPNYGALGTFNANGGIDFGGFGADNGGDPADAQALGGYLSQALPAYAQQRGLMFNPNAAGYEISVGGYGDRGMFYLPGTSPSPEVHAAFSRDPDAYMNIALGDLAARGVYVPQGTTDFAAPFANANASLPMNVYQGFDPNSNALGDLLRAATDTSYEGVFGRQSGAINAWNAENQRVAAIQASQGPNAWQNTPASFWSPADFDAAWAAQQAAQPQSNG